jgi:hypothetical protein
VANADEITVFEFISKQSVSLVAVELSRASLLWVWWLRLKQPKTPQRLS